jgi:FG-GAP-like repeat/Bacterial Ig-like domain (group 3)
MSLPAVSSALRSVPVRARLIADFVLATVFFSILFFGLTLVAQGPPRAHFKNTALYPTGGITAESVAVGDLNGDGNPDIVAVDQAAGVGPGDGEVSVRLGNGDGTFQAPVLYYSGGRFAVSVAIADLNHDGKLDVVVANQCPGGGCVTDRGPAEVSVLFGKGDGNLFTAVPYSSGGYSFAVSPFVTIGDVNGDGKPDLIVSNGCKTENNCVYPAGPGGVTVRLNAGHGKFPSSVSYSSGGYDANSVVVADLNGDNKPDLVVSNRCDSLPCGGSNPGVVGILINKGNGTFNPPVTLNSGGYYSVSVAVGDVNGDGHPDIIAINKCQNSSDDCGGSVLDVFLGDGKGWFGPPIPVSVPDNAVSARVADMNGDGKLDLVVSSGCDSCSNLVSVLPGNGDGTFQAPVKSFAGGYNNVSPPALGDFNRDGRLDVAVANDCTESGAHGFCENHNGIVGVLVNNFLAVTTTTLTVSPNPAQVGAQVTLTATVTSTTSIPPDMSVVVFSTWEGEIGTATTLNGVATLTVSFPKAEKRAVKARYIGDVFHRPSSATVSEVVQ